MIGRTVLHYRITDRLGEGGMGVVFKAEDTKLRRSVAIKFLPPQFASSPDRRQRLEIEARAAAALNHPNVAHIYAIETLDDELFIVMEYVQGRELRALTGARMPLARVLDLGTQIAQGLKAAHDRGVVHRDIKPANVLLTDENQIKITDFGLARLRDNTRVTRSGMTVGTLAYMSPEQARGEDVDHRTDIWSLGVVLHELLTGQLPFSGDYDQALVYSILNEIPGPPSALADGVPSAMDALIRRALAKDRADRYADMDELLRDLSSIRNEGATTSRRVSAEPSRPQLPGLAVLPFVGIKPDPETDFLGFALADQIISALAYVRSLAVRPSSAVRKYQGEHVDASTAAHELHADFVLMGHYLKDGDFIRLNVELVRIQSNDVVWAESIGVRYQNAFKLQEMVSRKVLRGLKVQFSPAEKSRMQADVPKEPLAYEYYLRAISYPLTLDGDRLALEMLEKSVGLDPSYAPAHAEMGFRYQQRANEWWSDIDGRTHAERAFHKALSLNESLLPALWHLSAFYVETGEFDRAAEFIRRMFRVTQKSAMAHYALGYLYRYLGLLDESVREVELALSIDPRNPRFRSAALTYFYNADYAKAYETLGLAGDSTLSLAWMGTIDFVRGDTARSLANLDRAIAMNRESYIGRRHAAIRAHILGVPDEARREMQELEAIARHDVDSEHWYLLGNVYALLGDAENCARCVRRGAARGFLNYPGMLKDPFLDRVRDEPVVVQALALVREKHEHFKNTFAFANEES